MAAGSAAAAPFLCPRARFLPRLCWEPAWGIDSAWEMALWVSMCVFVQGGRKYNSEVWQRWAAFVHLSIPSGSSWLLTSPMLFAQWWCRCCYACCGRETCNWRKPVLVPLVNKLVWLPTRKKKKKEILSLWAYATSSFTLKSTRSFLKYVVVYVGFLKPNFVRNGKSKAFFLQTQ